MENPSGHDEAELSGRECLDFEIRYDFRQSSPIARGGQAEIFRVYDRFLKRDVALKRLCASGIRAAAARVRFFAEAQITAQLQHPGFLPILDSGLDPFGRPFYTTYLLPGRTFQDVLESVRGGKGGRPDRAAFRRAVEVLERVVLIVAYAHSREVFHRDLKPNNILLGHFDEVFLIDMGAAFVAWASTEDQAWDPAGESDAPVIRTDRESAGVEEGLQTHDSGRPWHPLYSPPEMVRGEIPDDPRTTDIYALGVMLYELCCGQRPYSDADRSMPDHEELIRRILAGPPASLDTFRVWMPADLRAIAAKAMNYEPALRYRTVREMAADLRAHLETRVVQATHPGLAARGAKWIQRHALGVAIAVVLGAVLAISGMVARSFKIKSDAAGQLNHLREAQLAARSGKWEEALRRLESAERAGHADGIDLDLQRYAAHIALSESVQASNVLARLEKSPRLGDRSGAVLLRKAEFELFSPDTAEAGVKHVREALTSKLDRADRLFAMGLVAPTTSQALDFFHQALDVDPYHHGAHRQSLGLEFILARNDRLASHIATLRILYPSDPSPVFLEGCRLALDGRLAEAEAVTASLKAASSDETWLPFASGLRMMSEAFETFDPARFVLGRTNTAPKDNPLVRDAILFFSRKSLSPSTNGRPAIRLPQLPCVKAGLERGMRAIYSIMLTGPEGGDAAVQLVHEAIAIHPEGLIPLAAASIREARRPIVIEQQIPFLRSQEQLLHAATRLPSILTPVPSVARLLSLAVLRDLQRIGVPADPATVERRRILFEDYVRSPHTNGPLNRKLFDLAFELRELDSASIFLGRWERAGTEVSEAGRARVELDFATRNYPRALELLSRRLEADPDDTWALEMKAKANDGLRSVPLPPNTPPTQTHP